jgi:hypothetical protein
MVTNLNKKKEIAKLMEKKKQQLTARFSLRAQHEQ